MAAREDLLTTPNWSGRSMLPSTWDPLMTGSPW
jgi:hypothetical protein